jgi:hypothetical protein
MMTATPPIQLQTYARMWGRTWEHRCCVCDVPVSFAQVVEGDACLSRIGGNSANGYEVMCTCHAEDVISWDGE